MTRGEPYVVFSLRIPEKVHKLLTAEYLDRGYISQNGIIVEALIEHQKNHDIKLPEASL
jgi:hypothetical protein